MGATDNDKGNGSGALRFCPDMVLATSCGSTSRSCQRQQGGVTVVVPIKCCCEHDFKCLVCPQEPVMDNNPHKLRRVSKCQQRQQTEVWENVRPPNRQ